MTGLDEGGDPACWLHLFEPEPDGASDEGAAATAEPREGAQDAAGPADPGSAPPPPVR